MIRWEWLPIVFLTGFVLGAILKDRWVLRRLTILENKITETERAMNELGL